MLLQPQICILQKQQLEWLPLRTHPRGGHYRVGVNCQSFCSKVTIVNLSLALKVGWSFLRVFCPAEDMCACVQFSS